MKSFTMSLALALLSIQVCQAVDYTATTNGSWNTATNWSPNGIPGANDNVIIPSPRVMTVPGATINVTNLTIDAGGTLNFNTSGGILNIRNSGTVTVNGTIGGTSTNKELNFLDNSGTYSMTNNGTVTLNLLDVEGSNSNVTISGSGTTTVGDFNINNSGITVTLNKTLTINAATFTILNSDFTLNGTGTMNLFTQFNVQSDNVSVGITMNIPGDLALYDVDNQDFTLTSGANITVTDDLRIGPSTGASSNNMIITVNSGATLTVTDDMRINENNRQINDFTFNNSGTVTINGSTDIFNFTNTDRAIFSNSGTFTLNGSLTGASAGADAATFNNNATLNIGADIDNDVIMNFSATGNTVNYNSNANQTIENPTNSRYYNLTLSNPSGNPIKTLSVATDIDGSVTIQNSSTFSVNNLNITVGGNWTNSGTAADPFTQGNGTVTFDGSGTTQQTITNTGDADATVFNNVTINSTSTTSPQIILNDDVTVQGTLTMTAGNVDLNSNTFQLGINGGTTGTLSHAGNDTNGWMYGGNFTRWFGATTFAVTSDTGFFPMGSSTDYRPFRIGRTAGNQTGSVTVSHTNATVTSPLSPSVADDLPITLRHDAFWTSSASFTAGTYDLLAGGSGFGIVGDVDDLRLMLVNSVVGTPGTNSGTVSIPLVNRTGLTSGQLDNNFYIGSVDAVNSPLPIDLLSFVAQVNDSNVLLTWSTSTETNNGHFTIERSKDGFLFETVGEVPGAGNSEVKNDYELIDDNPYQGKSYYRLSQTDYDGTTKYFPIVSVEVVSSKFGFKLFPNPTRGEFDIELLHAEETVCSEIGVFDLQGKQVFTVSPLTVSNKVNNKFHIVSPQGLLPGIYIVKLNYGQRQFISKLVVE